MAADPTAVSFHGMMYDNMRERGMTLDVDSRPLTTRKLPVSPVLMDVLEHIRKSPDAALASTAILFAQIGAEYVRQLNKAGNAPGAEAVFDVVQSQAVPNIPQA